ncbi:hypothetical protein DFP72DRAFT_1173033 [Ephemerocybe angulata]|uniref:Uncharacterized protein n=1 Tax=Ephemerocybe angulata TaxID=980116 RepID=A0A8H6HP32_9AGAR|nr:hypothetical protein DFP72DRAFT_1173033 [Tulosesus angulatus]
MVAIYTGFSITVHTLWLRYNASASRALPLSQIDRELGYACTWLPVSSPEIIMGNKIGGFISLAKAILLAALALFIFSVRYRSQTGTLIQTIRRDSGIWIVSFVAIRLGNSLTLVFRIGRPGSDNLTHVFALLSRIAVPVLACRLLLDIRKTEDPIVRTTVSSILFDPPLPGDDSLHTDEELTARPSRRKAGKGRLYTNAEEAGERANAILEEGKQV